MQIRLILEKRVPASRVPNATEPMWVMVNAFTMDLEQEPNIFIDQLNHTVDDKYFRWSWE